MASCECGCGKESAREFLPGHDQKLRTRLESRVGGFRNLRSLVEAAELHAHGELSDETFTQRARSLFAAAGHHGT
jgi:hypothetical protein